MDIINGNEPIDVDQLANLYTDILKTPMISSANITTDDENVLTIYSEWIFDDLTKKDRTTITKNYTILKSSLTGNNSSPIVYSTTPVPINKKLSSFSKSGLKKAVVVTKNSALGNGDETEFLEIYDQKSLVKSYDLKELDLHKGVYTGGNFGSFGSTLIWNNDETKLMYLAEKKIPKPKPFFTSPGSNMDSGSKSANDTNTNAGKGEEFVFRQSWGETLNTCYDSVIVFLDLTNDKFKVVELPDGAFPCDLQWKDNQSVVGVALPNVQWRLGLVHCSNRDSRIFQINIDGANFRYLNQAGRASMSPRISPNGKYLVWQEREVLGPHDKARNILALQLEQDTAPAVVYDQNPGNEIPIYEDFPFNCWSSDSLKFFTVTSNETDNVLLAFSLKNGQFYGEPAILRGINNILSITKDFILISKSHAAQPPALHLLSQDFMNIVNINVTKSLVPFPLVYHKIEGVASPASYYYGPANVKESSVPLVAFIHGGPHAVISDAFYCEITVFLKLGFGVLHVNFIGSTGGKQDVTENLLGKIGVDDVQDCQDILQKLLTQEKSIDKKKVVIYGGSHSGFLGAHLTSQFPDSYRAAVLRNPVTDVLPLTAVSDITDWAFIESGVPVDTNVTPVVRTAEDAEKLIRCSPIHNTDKVKAATLLLLGSEDLRVPMSQGMAYYRALKASNKVTEVRVYPDTHSLRKVPCRFDSFMHSLVWFLKHLKQT